MVFISISGGDFINILLNEGYVIISQKGSHVKLKNKDNGHILIIPKHSELKEGLFNGILSQIGDKNKEKKIDLFNRLFKR